MTQETHRRLKVVIPILAAGVVGGGCIGIWISFRDPLLPGFVGAVFGAAFGLVLISMPGMGLWTIYNREAAQGSVHPNIKRLIWLWVVLPLCGAVFGWWEFIGESPLGGAIAGFSFGLIITLFLMPLRLFFEPWRGRRIRSRLGQSASTEAGAAALAVPYCSDACEELSAKTLSVAWLMKQSGPCTFCTRPVVYGAGFGTMMFPYRNQKAFLCSACLPKARNFMAGVKECCLCGKEIKKAG